MIDSTSILCIPRFEVHLSLSSLYFTLIIITYTEPSFRFITVHGFIETCLRYNRTCEKAWLCIPVFIVAFMGSTMWGFCCDIETLLFFLNQLDNAWPQTALPPTSVHLMSSALEACRKAGEWCKLCKSYAPTVHILDSRHVAIARLTGG